jgi:nucleoside-diphosphate-sugar epimerase
VIASEARQAVLGQRFGVVTDVADRKAVADGGTPTQARFDARQAGVGRVVLTSSAATCGPVPGRPADERDVAPEWELKVPYKATKLAAERLALEHAAGCQDVVIVNPTTAVGSDDRRPTPSGQMVRDVAAARMRGYLVSGGLNLVAVQDVARGHVLALERAEPASAISWAGRTSDCVSCSS